MGLMSDDINRAHSCISGGSNEAKFSACYCSRLLRQDSSPKDWAEKGGANRLPDESGVTRGLSFNRGGRVFVEKAQEAWLVHLHL